MPRARTPTKLKELAGNPGKRKINKAEPQPKGGPAAPSILSRAAKLIWARLISAMPPQVYTSADSNLLAAYCEAVANHQAVTKALMTAPMTVTGSTGQDVLNPLYKHQSDQARLIVTLGARLGLDPIARQSITSGDDGPMDDEGFDIR